MYNFAYFCVVFAVLLNTGSSLKCYNCISKNSEACANPLAYEKDIQPQTCNMGQINELADKAKDIAHSLGTAFGIDIPPAKTEENIPVVCQKIVAKVGSGRNAETVIVRGCQVPTPGEKSFCQNLKDKVAKDNVITDCELCDTDGCNSGHWLAPKTLTSILIPLIAVVWTLNA